MRSSLKLIQDGKTTTISSRQVEYYLKCPLKYTLNKEFGRDLTSAMYKALDQTISHSTTRLVIEDVPSLESLKTQFRRRLKVEVEDTILPRADKILTKYHKAIIHIMKNYSFIVPSFVESYSAYGCTIEAIIHLPIRSRKAIAKATRYLLVEYTEVPTVNWNVYGKLWISLVKRSIMERGISAIEIGVLNIATGKVLIPPLRSKSISRKIINDICAFISSDLSYPTFGKHCHGCVYQRECTDAISL